jgi:hypothetical protein
MYAPFVFFSIQPYPPVAIAVFFYLEFEWEVPFPHSLVERATLQLLLEAFPSLSTLGEVAPLLPSQAGLFICSSHEGVPLPSTLVNLSTGQPLLQAFSTPMLLGGCRHSCLLWLACLFAVCMGSAPPQLSSGTCHTLAAVTSLPLSKHTGGGGAIPAFSGQLVYLQSR